MDRTADASLSDAKSPPVGVLYTVEGLGSVGGNLMQVGIFFYTNRQFGWGLRENFTLAALQGVVYVIGALAAHSLSKRFRATRLAMSVYAILGAIGLAPLFTTAPLALAGAVLAYTGLTGIAWPIIESLVALGVDAKRLARRISHYNLVWSGTGAATIAVNGAIIDHWPAGVFAITAIAHAVGAILLLQLPTTIPATSTPTHAEPEPELLRVRTLALWLSRISMPASYALVYGLSALLPSLPVMRHVEIWVATLVGSTWLVSRWLTFLILGMTDWWHTRPRAMLAAAWMMLAAFAGVAWQPSHDSLATNLAWLVLCQVVIGVGIGTVYYASLYFGMVLSEGSTEHSGYHEALIGLGSILGPGAGMVAQIIRPGETSAGVFAVAAVLLSTSVLATVASTLARRQR
jgi:MFS family permease